MRKDTFDFTSALLLIVPIVAVLAFAFALAVFAYATVKKLTKTCPEIQYNLKYNDLVTVTGIDFYQDVRVRVKDRAYGRRDENGCHGPGYLVETIEGGPETLQLDEGDLRKVTK